MRHFNPLAPAADQGTGFVFEHHDPQGVRWALETALATWKNRPVWRQLMHNGMRQDFSWDKQAGLYESVYLRLSGQEQGAAVRTAKE